MTGNVLWFNPLKGYGFIESEKGQIYLHHTSFKDVKKTQKGDKLEFEVEDGEKGLKAKNVIKIE